MSESSLPLSEAELSLIERVRRLPDEAQEELMEQLTEDADSAFQSAKCEAMLVLCRLVPKAPPQRMVLVAADELDALRADLTAKESMIRSMTDPQGKEWAESVRISELEADLTAAQEEVKERDRTYLAVQKAWEAERDGLAERLEKAEAALRDLTDETPQVLTFDRNGHERWQCAYCHGESRTGNEADFPHSNDCRLVKARAGLGKEDTNDGG